jgi:ADP-heptose:LPS heptosyltransferase
MPNRLAIAPNTCKYQGFRLLAGLERVLRHNRQKTLDELRSIRNFLFLQYDMPLGSAVHATPLYQAIRQLIPDAHISVAASSMAASVLRHNPYVDRCVATPLPWQGFAGAVHSVRQLYKALPDGPVCLATTASNQRPRLAALALLAGSATRVGYTLATPLYHLALDFCADRPQLDSNLEILRALGHETSTLGPQVFFSREEVAYADRFLSQSGTPADCPKVAYVTQCSGNQPKQWDTERFRRVIADLHRLRHATTIFFGTANEAAAIDALRQPLAAPSISLAGKTTVPQMAAVLAQCDLVVSLDTGSFHVARAVGLPGVVLAPAWQNPMEWLPVGLAQYRVLCGPRIPMPTTEYRMQETSVEQVLTAALALLEAYPATAAARTARVERSLATKT